MQPDIVLVDDDALVVSALSRLLSRAGLPVWGTTDPLQALARIQRSAPVAVVADHQMPGMTGLELLARAGETAPHTLRVLITGNPTLQVLADAINECHIHSYFPKPLPAHKLLASLTRAYDAAHGRQLALAMHAERPDDVIGDELFDAAVGVASALGLGIWKPR